MERRSGARRAISSPRKAILCSWPSVSERLSLGIGVAGDDPPPHGQAVLPVQGHRFEFCAYVGDLNAGVERLRSEGTPVLFEPSEMPWGERIAYISDPDGDLIMLTEAST
jgi:predicted enzyme related to lactoylglutathione lyase